MFPPLTHMVNLRGHIEGPTAVQQTDGSMLETWTRLYFDVPMQKAELSASEVERYKRDGVTATHKILIDRNLPLTEKNRVVLDARTYDIKSAINPSRSNAGRSLICEEVR